MAQFKVTSIIDGDTFEVTPQWRWKNQTGNRVRPTGYDAPEMHAAGGQNAKSKLSKIILGDQVELSSAYKIDHDRLVCDVYYNGKYLADYFPDYQ